MYKTVEAHNIVVIAIKQFKSNGMYK